MESTNQGDFAGSSADSRSPTLLAHGERLRQVESKPAVVPCDCRALVLNKHTQNTPHLGLNVAAILGS